MKALHQRVGERMTCGREERRERANNNKEKGKERREREKKNRGEKINEDRERERKMVTEWTFLSCKETLTSDYFALVQCSP